MKKAITKIALIASLVLILDSFKFWPGFLEFFFAGIVPGTEERLDPILMLTIFSITACLIIGKVFVLPYIRKTYFPKTKRHTLKTSAKLA